MVGQVSSTPEKFHVMEEVGVGCSSGRRRRISHWRMFGFGRSLWPSHAVSCCEPPVEQHGRRRLQHEDEDRVIHRRGCGWRSTMLDGDVRPHDDLTQPTPMGEVPKSCSSWTQEFAALSLSNGRGYSYVDLPLREGQ